MGVKRKELTEAKEKGPLAGPKHFNISKEEDSGTIVYRKGKKQKSNVAGLM